MKTNFATVLTLALSSTALAQTPSPTGPLAATDPYTALAAQYASGYAPAAADIVGWYSGRCYRPNNPLQPYASLLLVHTTGDGGPEFPGPSVEVNLYVNDDSPSGPSTIYDTLTPSQDTQVSNFIQAGADQTTAAASDTDPDDSRPELLGTYAEDSEDTVYYYTRKTGSTLTVKVGTNHYQPVSVSDYCYFFNKVK